MKLLQLFSYFRLAFSHKNFEPLFNTVLGKDGLICDDVGWWSGLKKCGYGIGDVDIGLLYIVDGMGINNQVIHPMEH